MVEAISNPKGGWFFEIQGIRLPFGLTEETGVDAASRMLTLFRRDEQELLPLAKEYRKKVEWNHSNPGAGKNWPIFRTLEKRLKVLQKEAGIIDS